MTASASYPSEVGPFWSLLSGGKDSVAATHYLAERGQLRGCVFLETGVAAPDTRPFVEGLCRDEGWELRVFATPKSYEALVGRFGFPKGPRGHTWFYRALKERPLRAAARELGPEAMFASGVRTKESARRMLTAQRWSRVRGGWIYAPILDWSDRQVWAYLGSHKWAPSPCSVALGLSGDCFCGAFSKPGECRAIADLYPEFAARILALEESVPKGYPLNRWGNRSAGFGGTLGATRLEQFVCSDDCRPKPDQRGQDRDDERVPQLGVGRGVRADRRDQPLEGDPVGDTVEAATELVLPTREELLERGFRVQADLVDPDGIRMRVVCTPDAIRLYPMDEHFSLRAGLRFYDLVLNHVDHNAELVG